MRTASSIRRASIGIRPRRRTPGGYLLLEILIAMTIFSVGFLALGTLVVSTSANNTAGNIVTQATLLAAEALEDLKNSPDITGLAPGAYGDGTPIDAQGNPGGIFTRTWVVSDLLGFDTSRHVTVSVGWNRLGRSRTVQLSTIIRGNGQ